MIIAMIIKLINNTLKDNKLSRDIMYLLAKRLIGLSVSTYTLFQKTVPSLRKRYLKHLQGSLKNINKKKYVRYLNNINMQSLSISYLSLLDNYQNKLLLAI